MYIKKVIQLADTQRANTAELSRGAIINAHIKPIQRRPMIQRQTGSGRVSDGLTRASR